MRFSRAGRTRGDLPKKSSKTFKKFFWDVWVHIERHRLCTSGMSDPPFSTNSFTRVAILDPRTPMGPKGKRNRRGVLLSLLQCLRQTPGSPCTPLGLAHGFFRPKFLLHARGVYSICLNGGELRFKQRGLAQLAVPVLRHFGVPPSTPGNWCVWPVCVGIS